MKKYVMSASARFTRLRWNRKLSFAVFFLALTTSYSARADIWINEFVADNEAGLRTAQGLYADWIELANSSPAAVGLGGWFLTDQTTNLTRWRIPDGTTIPGNGFLLIVADSSPVSLTNNELHANFSLSKEGEYLGLVLPDGATVVDAFAPAFPPQLADVSYGRGSLRERALVGPETPFRYRIPNADATAPWTDASGALGFSATNGTFIVRYYELNTNIANVDFAEMMLTNGAYWRSDRSYPLLGQYDIIDFHGSSASGSFTNDVLFPGHTTIEEDRDNFVVVVDAAITVPAPGLWTFAVGSDDGFRLRISGRGVDFVSEYPTGRSFDATLATFNFPAAGSYSLRLIYYEASGDAGVELSAAQGFHESFTLDAFRLVGDPECPLACTGIVSPFVDTDIAAAMRHINSRLDAEWLFHLDQAPAPDDVFTLSVRCADGFSATLNGLPIAALNAPGPLFWNSAATASRMPGAPGEWLSYFVPAAAFVAGINTLAVAALNDSLADPEFLIQAQLGWHAARSFPAYFKTPTPRTANSRAFTAPTPAITVSEPRGYRTSPFTVSLSCWEPFAEIRYTLDGTVPTTNSPVYTNPLDISRTTTLRAAVVDAETVRQTVTTVSWLFLEDILQQGPTPPPGWPTNREVNNHVMEYGLRPEIVTGDPVRLRTAMTNTIPSISLVTDLANLFNPQRGIYVNPGNDGLTWERPVSVELIDPVRGSTAEFHIDAGLRIRGAFSRSASNPKHAFRLFFRSDYGEGKLRFRLFDEEGAAEFDKVDLRTSQNYSWAYQNNTKDTFVRETFSRDSQRDMGMPYTRSRYYHLYLNGQYWGLYQTQERGDADFAETYLGGANDQWDCIKTTQPGYTTTASDGTFNAFYALYNLAINQGFTGVYTNNYLRAKGLNPDGTRNPAYPVYLDEDNLIVFMLIAYYTGDPDSPVSIWGGMPNNMYGLFNRVTPAGFKWLRHDAEHSLGAHGTYPVTCDTTTAGSNFTSQAKFNPATLHQRLCQNADYRRRFADLVQKHLYGDGALTPTNAQRRFQSRMDELDLAIIGESARWGRGKTRDATWLPACNWVLNNYLNQRRDIIVGHFRTRGWFPSLDAPGFSVMNAEVPAGHILRVSGTSNFYYTTNGADPRLPDGSLNPAAIAVTTNTQPTEPRTLLRRAADWRFFDTGAEPAASGKLTWRDVGYPDSGWGHGPAIIGFAGSSTTNTVSTVTRRYVSGSSGPQVTTTYLRHNFTLDTTNGMSSTLFGDLLRDDGVVIYLNGTEILRENMTTNTTTYGTYSAGIVSSPDQNTYFSFSTNAAHLLRIGSNTVAVELHQCNSTSSDLYFDFSLTVNGISVNVAADLAVTRDLTVKARAFDGNEWSALSENTLTLQRPPADYTRLRVSELMYAPPAPVGPSPFVNDDFAWIELRNTWTWPLELDGVSLVTGITHTFAPLTLGPGERVVLAKNPAAFATRHSTNQLRLVAWTSGNLARRGETLALFDPAGNNILTFIYSNLWYPETYDTGFSLVAVDLLAQEPLWSTPANWRPSSVPSGTPGFAERPAFTSTQATAGHLLVLGVSGLEGAASLWFSADLKNWQPCEAGAWSLSGDTLTVNLEHPSLPALGRCFFQMRVVE